MKHKGTLAIYLLFIVLTLVYFRNVITSPPDTILTNFISEDLSWHLAHTMEKLDWIKQGFFAVGDFWVPRGGGFPAGGIELENILTAGELLIMPFYAITNNILFAHKIAHFLFYLLALVFAYHYGMQVLRHRDAGVVFAVAYGFTQATITWEKNVNLAAALCLLPLFLLFLERMIRRLRYLDAVLASLFLLLLFLDSWYVTFFTLIFISFRIVFALITQRDRAAHLARVSGLFLALSFLLCFPFVYPLLLLPQSRVSSVSQIPPTAYLTRSTVGVLLTARFPQFAYLGYSVLSLGLLPLILGIFPKFAVKDYWKNYLLYLFTAIFFFLYTIGSYSAINVTELVVRFIPFGGGVRAINVGALMVAISAAMCASIGYATMGKLLPLPGNVLKLKSSFLLIPLIVITGAVYSDITVGFEPSTLPHVFKDNPAYTYIRQQPGDFRIIEIPSAQSQQSMTNAYTGHDTLNFLTYRYAFGYYGFLIDYSEIWWQTTRIAADGLTPINSASVTNIDFNEGQGQSIFANGVSNFAGNSKDITWTEGVSGSALGFNGKGSFVEIPHDESFDLGRSGALEFWIKLPVENEAVDQGWIIGKGGGWDRPGWAVTTIHKNHIRFHWQSGDDILIDSTTALEYQKWYHVAAVYDGYMLRLYINGQRDISFLYADSINAATEHHLRIGLDDSSLLPFRGDIDEIRIHKNLPLGKSLAFHGVKYLVINTDPEYYQTLKEYGMVAQKDWADFLVGHTDESFKATIPFWLTREEVMDIESIIAHSDDFTEAYHDENFRIYENLEYSGNVFAVVQNPASQPSYYGYELADATVKYHVPGMNRIVAEVENQEPVWLVVSQNFNKGWTATIQTWGDNGWSEKKPLAIGELSAVQYLQIETPGRHHIELKFQFYQNSLIFHACFFIIACYLICWVLYRHYRRDDKNEG